MNRNIRKKAFLMISTGGMLDDIGKYITDFDFSKFVNQITSHFKDDPKKQEEAKKAVEDIAKKREEKKEKFSKKTKDLEVHPGEEKHEEDDLLSKLKKLWGEEEKIKDDKIDVKREKFIDGQWHELSAPALRGAIFDLSQKYEKANKSNCGIIGDAEHAKRTSDHNTGDAIDIPISIGANGDEIASMALKDPRTRMVIWNKRIYYPGKGSSPYTGPNPHTGHVHVSINKDMRNDTRPWPWAK